MEVAKPIGKITTFANPVWKFPDKNIHSVLETKHLHGIVAHGDALGRTIGFPTANLETPDPLPPHGTYVAEMEWQSHVYFGVLNIGLRPTVHGKELRVEIHLLDFKGTLYGEKVTITPLLFLREERKFDSVEALKQQITADVAIARDYLNHIRESHPPRMHAGEPAKTEPAKTEPASVEPASVEPAPDKPTASKPSIFLLILWIFTFGFGANAQSFKGDLKLGLLASQIDGDNLSGYHKPGLCAGIAARLQVPETAWEFSIGMEYLQKGCKATNYKSEGAHNDYHLTMHQIGLPVTAAWNCAKNLYLEAGCGLNIVPFIRLRQEGEVYTLDTDDDAYRFFEWGCIGGFQWRKNEHWGIHLLFRYSLTAVGKSFYKKTGLRNNSLELSASYTF